MPTSKNFTEEQYYNMLQSYDEERDTHEQLDTEAIKEEIICYCKAFQGIHNTGSTYLYDMYYHFGSSGVNPYYVYHVLIELERKKSLYVIQQKIVLY